MVNNNDKQSKEVIMTEKLEELAVIAPKKKKAPAKKKDMTFGAATLALLKGGEVERKAWAGSGLKVSLSPCGSEFLVPCGKSYSIYRAGLEDAQACDWVLVK